MNTSFNYDKSRSISSFECSIERLQMYICVFNPSLRPSTMHYLLKPFDLKMKASVDQHQYLILKCEISEINLNISPSSAGFLYNSVMAITRPIELKSEVLKKSEDYSEIWIPNKLNKEDYYFLIPGKQNLRFKFIYKHSIGIIPSQRIEIHPWTWKYGQ